MSAIKVLVIDDEVLMMKSTCMVLKYKGFDAHGTLDGNQGISDALSLQPDIILLDIMMPGKDGWQVLRELKESSQTKNIPVVIFSAREYSDGRQKAQKCGAVDFIPKPFETDFLIDILTRYGKKEASHA